MRTNNFGKKTGVKEKLWWLWIPWQLIQQYETTTIMHNIMCPSKLIICFWTTRTKKKRTSNHEWGRSNKKQQKRKIDREIY